jgi:hypothetical protein
LGPPASSLLLGLQLVGHTIDWTAKENLTIRMCIMAAAHFDRSVFGVTLTHTKMYFFSGFSQQFTRPSQIHPLLHDVSSLFMSYDESELHWFHIKSPEVFTRVRNWKVKICSFSVKHKLNYNIMMLQLYNILCAAQLNYLTPN